MLSTEFTGNKEDTCRSDAPASLGAEPTAHPVALESSSTAERHIPSESKHVFQARAQVPTPPDRQRTAQACDKCRERKTKCSGDHPVCNRCTTRGLICKYSSREARPRGPSNMQLRSTVSSLDLRPQQKTSQNVPARQESQRVQGHSQKSMSGQCYSRAFVENRHSDYVPRRASVPQSNHDFLEFHPTSMSGSTPQEYCGMPLLGYEPSHGGTTFIQPQQHLSGNKEHFQQRWPEVPRNESHINIDGGSDGATALQYGLHGPAPLRMVGLNPYVSISSHGRVSPTFQHPLPLLERAAVGQFEAQKAQHVERMYSWGYHSDSSSSGSSTGESYSPISSEDAPEPHSRSSSSLGFGLSGHFDLAPASDIGHLFRYTGLEHDATVYSTSSAFMSFANDSEREIQAGLDFTYPSSVGVNILQEESFKEGFYDLELRT